MERSAPAEEELAEKTTIFYLHHSCSFLEEALRALFRCLGLEIGTNRDSRKQGLKDASSSDAERYSSSSQTTEKENSTNTEDNASNNQKSSQQDPTTTEQEVDPPSTAQEQQLIERSRRGPQRSGLDRGKGPQVN